MDNYNNLGPEDQGTFSGPENLCLLFKALLQRGGARQGMAMTIKECFPIPETWQARHLTCLYNSCMTTY